MVSLTNRPRGGFGDALAGCIRRMYSYFLSFTIGYITFYSGLKIVGGDVRQAGVEVGGISG